MATPATQPETGAQEESGATRLTSRQRRIEEQRRKIEQLRREQRRKRALWGTGILLVFVAVAALFLTQVRPPATAQGRQLADEGATHLPVGSPLSYRSRPPASGPHYEAQAAGYQFYEREVDPGYWVHSLEHGAVALLYHPEKCDAACIAELRDVYSGVPAESRYRSRKMLVTPYPGMDRKIAVVAWRWVDEMDEIDRDRIIAFYREHVNQGPENVP